MFVCCCCRHVLGCCTVLTFFPFAKPSVQGLNYDFHPSMGAMEDLSAKLPTNLPLENIANYNYAAEAGANTSIAPSMFQNNKAALPDLPAVSGFADGPSALEPSQQTVQVGPTDGPPPPPPPPPSLDFSDGSAPPPPPLPPADLGLDDDSAPPPPPPPQVEDDVPPPPPPAPMNDDVCEMIPAIGNSQTEY